MPFSTNPLNQKMDEKKQLAVLVGSKVRAFRKMKKMTIQDLAFEVGIEYTQLSRIERGGISTSLYQLYIISKALEIDLVLLMKEIEASSFSVSS